MTIRAVRGYHPPHQSCKFAYSTILVYVMKLLHIDIERVRHASRGFRGLDCRGEAALGLSSQLLLSDLVRTLRKKVQWMLYERTVIS